MSPKVTDIIGKFKFERQSQGRNDFDQLESSEIQGQPTDDKKQPLPALEASRTHFGRNSPKWKDLAENSIFSSSNTNEKLATDVKSNSTRDQNY